MGAVEALTCGSTGSVMTVCTARLPVVSGHAAEAEAVAVFSGSDVIGALDALARRELAGGSRLDEVPDFLEDFAERCSRKRLFVDSRSLMILASS